MKKEYWLVIHKEKLEKVETALEALQILISAYFVLNLTYPPKCFWFLEFCQKHLFDISIDEVSKTRNKAKSKSINFFVKNLHKINYQAVLLPAQCEILNSTD